MKLTITNGNARNGVYGQRLRLQHRDGVTYERQMPGRAVTSRRWRPVLTRWAASHFRAEAHDRNPPRSAEAYAMLEMFIAGKARLMIDHNRRSIGHA